MAGIQAVYDGRCTRDEVAQEEEEAAAPSTRYCDSTCQHDHWRRGHKQMCKKIHRGGNAEQYYADKKDKEAVAVAVEACADDSSDCDGVRARDKYSSSSN